MRIISFGQALADPLNVVEEFVDGWGCFKLSSMLRTMCLISAKTSSMSGHIQSNEQTRHPQPIEHEIYGSTIDITIRDPIKVLTTIAGRI